ncbi:MAG: Na+/H+ antiporter NhaA [Acidobacteria bacterium]|nr:MAG: Na+/H+ antiporter NhaA [Acidobacteriota bacterium]
MSADQRKSGFRGYFEWFVHSEATGSMLLLACTVVALLWANSPWAATYFDLLHTYVGVSWGDATFKLSLHHWINDGLMVIFFFVVGLEIKRELVVGELSSIDKAGLPVAAAIGGMIVPAALFISLNWGGVGSRGWGIPMATDIAFALGILALFGSRAPIGLKVFLTALAIADDLGAVAVIAIFYTESINVLSLVVAAILLAVLFVAIQARWRRGLIYMLILGIWLAVFSSGVHATVAGILVAMVIPVRPRVDPHLFMDETEARIEQMRQQERDALCLLSNREQLNIVERIHSGAEMALPTGLVLERHLHPIQVWLILPLFALANAGVAIGGDLLAVLRNPLALGVIFGLVVGKPLGIGLLSWLAVRSGRGALPQGVAWTHVFGAGCLAGVGFTMSLFISDLAFNDEALIATAKIGILAASLVSGILGFIILARSLPDN